MLAYFFLSGLSLHFYLEAFDSCCFNISYFWSPSENARKTQREEEKQVQGKRANDLNAKLTLRPKRCPYYFSSPCRLQEQVDYLAKITLGREKFSSQPKATTELRHRRCMTSSIRRRRRWWTTAEIVHDRTEHHLNGCWIKPLSIIVARLGRRLHPATACTLVKTIKIIIIISTSWSSLL